MPTNKPSHYFSILLCLFFRHVESVETALRHPNLRSIASSKSSTFL